MQLIPITVMSCLLGLACAGSGSGSDAGNAPSWNGEIQVYGGLRAMLHEGQIGAQVTLGGMLPNPDLYGVGALADLSGEITVIDGRVYLSFPAGPDSTQTEATSETDAGAALFVAAVVPAWHSVTTEHRIRFEDLDEAIGELATSARMNLGKRFPFLLEGDFEDLQWHVIDGRRLASGETSHRDHLAASVPARRDRTSATLVGFYSVEDQGVFTHMGSRTHIHCVLDEPLSAGHVDHVTIPAGTTIRFPVVGRPRTDKGM